MFSEDNEMYMDEKEKMLRELMEILGTHNSGGSSSTPLEDVAEKILKSAKQDDKEKMVKELMEKLRNRRNLRDSGGPHDDNVSDMLEKIWNSAKKEDKPDPDTVDWTLLEALLVKFREEEETFSHGLSVDEAKLSESKQMDFENVKLRLPCRFSHGEDYPPPSLVPWYLHPLRPISQHQRKWRERNPNYAVSSKKYRKGACENCGALTHSLNTCLQGSLKRVPKST